MNRIILQIERDMLPQLIEKLQAHFVLSGPHHDKFDMDYLDTFDWSLFRQGQALARVHRNGHSQLLLSRHTDNKVLSRLPDPGPFNFTHELPQHPLRTLIQGGEKRALMQQFTMHCDSRPWNVLNKDEKIVARLEFHSCSILPNGNREQAIIERLFILPVRGYQKKADRILSILTAIPGVQVDDKSIIESALAATGRSTKEHSTRTVLDLEPGMEAETALKGIIARLLDVMEMNEDGIISEVDTEFLHDYRIAVRRTRSVIALLKTSLGTKAFKRFNTDFSWLGSVTGPARDLDVHLLDFEQYSNMLPKNMRNDIAPLRELILEEQQLSYSTLKKALQSARYKKLKSDWRAFIQSDARQATAKDSILAVASNSIWRSYTDTLKKGSKLGSRSASEAFHDERKECKKLRYLLEFFRKLYPRKELRKLITALQDIQDQLGKFQDLEVQEHVFHHFAEQLMERTDTQSGTLLAMGVLIERIIQQRKSVMTEFSEHYEAFSSADNRKLFKRIFKPDNSVSGT